MLRALCVFTDVNARVMEGECVGLSFTNKVCSD